MARARPDFGGRVAVALLVALNDDTASRIAAVLGSRGLEVLRAGTHGEAPSLVHFRSVEVVAAHAEPPEAFAALCESCADMPVIAVTADDDEQKAEALRGGAVAAIAAVADEAEIRLAVERALSAVTDTSSEEPPPASSRGGLLGTSEPMRQVADLIQRIAPLLATALLRGETGTGKELVARALHQQSPRRSGPFVKVHCAALPDALLESELFGYEKGAFTGATVRKPGRVELAEGGTLFLDEIGDITPAVQVKLLRLLQDKEYERLGGVRSLRANVRFVTATHRDLEGMVKRGEFREDLFYRLNVVTVWLPPLRARRDDIPLLAEVFANDFARAHGKPEARLDQTAIDALHSERWPGNVRQLQNFVERLVVLARGTITADDVRREMSDHARFETQLTSAKPASSPAAPVPAGESPAEAAPVPLDEAVRNAERDAIERALRHTKGNRTVAARILGVSRATLYAKLDEHGIS